MKAHPLTLRLCHRVMSASPSLGAGGPLYTPLQQDSSDSAMQLNSYFSPCPSYNCCVDLLMQDK